MSDFEDEPTTVGKQSLKPLTLEQQLTSVVKNAIADAHRELLESLKGDLKAIVADALNAAFEATSRVATLEPKVEKALFEIEQLKGMAAE